MNSDVGIYKTSFSVCSAIDVEYLRSRVANIAFCTGIKRVKWVENITWVIVARTTLSNPPSLFSPVTLFLRLVIVYLFRTLFFSFLLAWFLFLFVLFFVFVLFLFLLMLGTLLLLPDNNWLDDDWMIVPCVISEVRGQAIRICLAEPGYRSASLMVGRACVGCWVFRRVFGWMYGLIARWVSGFRRLLLNLRNNNNLLRTRNDTSW